MAGPPPAHLNGRAGLVLVVEDEGIIALDLTTTLEDEGYRVLGPALTVAAALNLLVRERPDAAVLDVNLRGEMVTPVARLLLQMRVPFAVASAYGPSLLSDDRVLADAPHLGKPMAPASLLAAVRDLLGREAG